MTDLTMATVVNEWHDCPVAKPTLSNYETRCWQLPKKRDGVTHVKARLWGRSVKMCPSGDIVFIPGAWWNAVRDTVRSTSRLRWTQTEAGTSRAPCFWWSALLRVLYRGGALFFVVCFEWFSSSPLMTTHQARGWEHRARERREEQQEKQNHRMKPSHLFFPTRVH